MRDKSSQLREQSDMSSSLARVPRMKRLFDLTVTLVMAPFWIPVCLLAALALVLTAGWSPIYSSKRRVHGREVRTVIKFRTMVRHADRVLNRDTIPVSDTAFLNIPPDHEVYTPVGRRIERYALTEIPQLLQVLAGSMSLIGNRPLPVNVVNALLQRFPYAEDRFIAPGGLTGPVQLVGREDISDEDRLGLEIDYSLLTTLSYSYRIDLFILWNTVLVALHLRSAFTVPEVRALMMRAAAPVAVPPGELLERRTSGVRFPVAPRSLRLADGRQVDLCEIGYRGLRIVADESIAAGTVLHIPSAITASGHLVAVVCWSRPADDGRIAMGLSLQPGADTVMALLDLLRGPGSGGGRKQGEAAPPSAARTVLPHSLPAAELAAVRERHRDEQPHAA